MKALLIVCIIGLLVLAACTEEELHNAMCGDKSQMSWKEKLFCLVYAPDAKNTKENQPGQNQPNQNPLFYGCNDPPFSEDACVSIAIQNYKNKNLCPSNTNAHFEKAKCEYKHYSGGGNYWDCYLNLQCVK